MIAGFRETVVATCAAVAITALGACSGQSDATYRQGSATAEIGQDQGVVFLKLLRDATVRSSGVDLFWEVEDWRLELFRLGMQARNGVETPPPTLVITSTSRGLQALGQEPDCRTAIDAFDQSVLVGRIECTGLRWHHANPTGNPEYANEAPFDLNVSFEARS